MHAGSHTLRKHLLHQGTEVQEQLLAGLHRGSEHVVGPSPCPSPCSPCHDHVTSRHVLKTTWQHQNWLEPPFPLSSRQRLQAHPQKLSLPFCLPVAALLENLPGVASFVLISDN